MSAQVIGVASDHTFRLSSARCQALLATRSVGRVTWRSWNGLQSHPMTYRWGEHSALLRSTPYGPLGGLGDETMVSLEISGIDLTGALGWSVLVRGSARVVAATDRLVTRLSPDRSTRGGSGSRDLFVQLVPHRISGHSFDASPG